MPVLSRAATGILFKLMSTVAFTSMSTLVRVAGKEIPVGEVVFCRSFFALIPLFIMLAWRHEIMDAFRYVSFLSHMKRGAIGATGMFSGFVGLTMLPLADSTAISYAAPLMVVPLAYFILGEQVRIYRWTAVAVGFVGVVVILWPIASAPGRCSRWAVPSAPPSPPSRCASSSTLKRRRPSSSPSWPSARASPCSHGLWGMSCRSSASGSYRRHCRPSCSSWWG